MIGQWLRSWIHRPAPRGAGLGRELEERLHAVLDELEVPRIRDIWPSGVVTPLEMRIRMLHEIGRQTIEVGGRLHRAADRWRLEAEADRDRVVARELAGVALLEECFDLLDGQMLHPDDGPDLHSRLQTYLTQRRLASAAPAPTAGTLPPSSGSIDPCLPGDPRQGAPDLPRKGGAEPDGGGPGAPIPFGTPDPRCSRPDCRACGRGDTDWPACSESPARVTRPGGRTWSEP